MSKCENCGAEVNGNFCPMCGAKVSAPAFCKNCGAKLENGAKFCPNCGTKVSDAAAPAAYAEASVAPSKSNDIGELQNELFSLYKILEPVEELNRASAAIGKKIAELGGHASETNFQYYFHFERYIPFISVDLDEDFITPSNRKDAKMWKAFIKRQKEKLAAGRLYNETAFMKKYNLEDVFRILDEHRADVFKNLGASYLWYKMDYCLDESNKFYDVLIREVKGKNDWTVRSYKVINTQFFINSYLKSKLGDRLDAYLAELLTKLDCGNRGEEMLCDMPSGYSTVETARYKYFFLQEGYPKEEENWLCRMINVREMGEGIRAIVMKYYKLKTELAGSIAELTKLKAAIDAAIAAYMKDVDLYIGKNVKIVPVSYARHWQSVAYFLYLIVNKRGRDIYEIVNQYEIDMKHVELTSALKDIKSEISSQTQVLGGKLDGINRSIVQQTEAITSAIWNQTRTLGAKLDGINFSVISSGASVVGAISELGQAMGQAMSNMKFNVSVS